eukprot:2170885-Rhodomonas_salina.1
MADLGLLIAATQVDNMHAVYKPGWANALLKLAYGTVLDADAEGAAGEQQGLLEEVVVTHHPAASSCEHPWAVARGDSGTRLSHTARASAGCARPMGANRAESVDRGAEAGGD